MARKAYLSIVVGTNQVSGHVGVKVESTFNTKQEADAFAQQKASHQWTENVQGVQVNCIRVFEEIELPD